MNSRAFGKPHCAFVVSGLRSGVGKTTVTLGLIRALSDRGARVAALKIGPDFLDPGHYTGAGAAFVRNLDPILQTVRGMKDIFAEAKTFDAIVVEGAMGLFDGPIPGKTTASTAAVARVFELPVVLVCDARASAQSVAAEIVGARALLAGGRKLDIPVAFGTGPSLAGAHIAGVILNFVASQRHAELLLKGIEKLARVKIAGCLFRDNIPSMPSRHLGLVPAAETSGGPALYARYAAAVSNAISPAVLCKAAPHRPSPPRSTIRTLRSHHTHDMTVAIAMDEVFSFYYPETIEFFKRHCRAVTFFSPLNDREAPEADLYYFGGGFPEVFASRLSNNRLFRNSLRRRLARPMSETSALEASETLIRPMSETSALEASETLTRGACVYAECGGLMYLSTSITTTDGKTFPMANVLPGKCVMHNRRQALGYWKARVLRKALFLEKGMTLIGHEYHWSTFQPPGRVSVSDASSAGGSAAGRVKHIYESQKIGASDRKTGGWAVGHILASYLHLSPLGNPIFFRKLLDWASKK